MNIYFFCDRTPDPKMVNDLGGTITDQFEGTISNIYRRGNQITFSEALRLGGQTINTCHLIPAESIVVVEEPILLQEPWLKAGISTLLILQTTEETGGWGKVLCKYCGLLQVHWIEAITSQWTGTNPTSTEKAEERMT